MKTPTVVRFGLFVAAASACLVVFAWAQNPAKPRAEAKPISVESLENQLPIGHLGVPLGTVVRVTGEAFDGDSTGRKADAGKTLLRIVSVDGKDLAKPVVFEFLRPSNTVKKPAPGDKFDYYVHEGGAFDGVVTPPKELGIETVTVANDGFHYRRHLTVLGSNSADLPVGRQVHLEGVLGFDGKFGYYVTVPGGDVWLYKPIGIAGVREEFGSTIAVDGLLGYWVYPRSTQGIGQPIGAMSPDHYFIERPKVRLLRRPDSAP